MQYSGVLILCVISCGVEDIAAWPATRPVVFLLLVRETLVNGDLLALLCSYHYAVSIFVIKLILSTRFLA